MTITLSHHQPAPLYGSAVFLPDSRSGLRGRLVSAFDGLRNGLKSGYPLCCVLNYSLDSFLGIPAGLSRGEAFSKSVGEYVPCHFHKRVHKSLSRSECLQLLSTGSIAEHLAPESTVTTIVDGKVIASASVPKGVRGVFLQQLVLESA